MGAEKDIRKTTQSEYGGELYKMEYAVIIDKKIAQIISTNNEKEKNWKEIPKNFDLKIGLLESWVDWEKGRQKSDDELVKLGVPDNRGVWYDKNGDLKEIVELGKKPEKDWKKEKPKEKIKRTNEDKRNKINKEIEFLIGKWCSDQGKNEFWFINQGILGGKDDKDYKKYAAEKDRLIKIGRDKKDSLISEGEE